MEVPLHCYAKKSKLNKKTLLYAFFWSGASVVHRVSARRMLPYFVLKHLSHSILTLPDFKTDN